MNHIPVFGEKNEEKNYQARYGVYSIVARENKEICLVQAPNGAYFLPGGEIEAGEDQEKALHRELMEELGATAEIGEFLGQADEYFYSSHRDKYYYNPAYIYNTKILTILAGLTQKQLLVNSNVALINGEFKSG